jgi:hypothetical protein
VRYNGLKGDGFIVLRSNDANVNFYEHETQEEAVGFAALENKGTPGIYIIYAPVAVIRPKMEADIEITQIGNTMMKKLPRKAK